MKEQILETVATYGLETIVIALAVNLLTGIIKLPIKAGARKMKDGTSLTRFIVFLPILLAAGLTLVYGYLTKGTWGIGEDGITIWLTASSLSLSIYAIFEKLVPSKRKILEGYEIEENKKLIETIKNITNATTAKTCGEAVAEVVVAVAEEQTVEVDEIVENNNEAEEDVVVERKRIVLRELKK